MSSYMTYKYITWGYTWSKRQKPQIYTDFFHAGYNLIFVHFYFYSSVCLYVSKGMCICVHSCRGCKKDYDLLDLESPAFVSSLLSILETAILEEQQAFLTAKLSLQPL